MVEHGYAATTMTQVAQVAGVAVQTLYASCPGGKPGLAKVVYDIALAGDAQPIPQAERPAVQAIIDETDVEQKLRLYSAMAAGIAQRIGPIHRILRAAAATTTDAGLHDLLAETEQRRRTGSLGLAQHVDSLGALRTGLTAEKAADQIFAVTSIGLFESLTQTCGWTVPEYEDWLTALLVATLLEPAR
jgi:AcrR family transcriptional regulator